MFTRIHPKNVHEMSSKKCPRKVTQKEDISWTFLSTKCRQKCPRDFTPFVHEMSPIMSTKCLPPLNRVIRVLIDKLVVQRIHFMLFINYNAWWKQKIFLSQLKPQSIIGKLNKKSLSEKSIKYLRNDLNPIFSGLWPPNQNQMAY